MYAQKTTKRTDHSKSKVTHANTDYFKRKPKKSSPDRNILMLKKWSCHLNEIIKSNNSRRPIIKSLK